MNTASPPPGGAPPAAPNTAPNPPAPPASPPATPPAGGQLTPPANEAEPHWLPDRIRQAKESSAKDTEKALLKGLGVETLDQAKARIKAADDAEAASKSELEKARDQVKALEPAAKRAKELEAATTEYAARMMVGLSAEQQKAIKDIAGDDAAAQIRTITALAPAWAAQGAAGAAAGAAGAAGATGATGGAGPTGAARPSNTAPPPGAPNGAAPPPADERGTYEAMRKANPFAAASYGVSHPAVYDPKKT